MDKKLRKKWLVYAVSGILLIGFGLSLLGESIILKITENSFLHWFGLGTMALAVIFAGLSFFGQAVVFKGQIDQDKKRD
ncbi:hypothetical protein [Cecembia sp.]|uniref:hypothetical protein n=1 Tax=Cecembia sp. TaxID=1898110 RepID=UPI0025BDF9F4|nr:hypothetical protein [Cecembia sp.]